MATDSVRLQFVQARFDKLAGVGGLCGKLASKKRKGGALAMLLEHFKWAFHSV